MLISRDISCYHQAIINQQSHSVSIAQHVASLLQSARAETVHSNILTVDRYKYYALRMKVRAARTFFMHHLIPFLSCAGGGVCWLNGPYCIIMFALIAVYMGVSAGVLAALCTSVLLTTLLDLQTGHSLQL